MTPSRTVLAVMLASLAAAAPAHGASVSEPVNDQVTDAVTQANVQVLGTAPAVAMGNLFIATSQALSNAAHNATNNQQQSYVTMQASTAQGVATLEALDTASSGCATYLTAGLMAACLSS